VVPKKLAQMFGVENTPIVSNEIAAEKAFKTPVKKSQFYC